MSLALTSMTLQLNSTVIGRCNQRSRRSALTIMEITFAFALLSVVLVASLQMVSLATGRQRESGRRELALQAAQGLLEQAGNIPWEQFTVGATDQFTIPSALEARLPNVKRTITVTPETDPTAKRVAVVVEWTTDGGTPSTVQLTGWVFPE
jgi:hypothetical protein